MAASLLLGNLFFRTIQMLIDFLIKRITSDCKVVDFIFRLQTFLLTEEFAQRALQENEPRFGKLAFGFSCDDREHSSDHVLVATDRWRRTPADILADARDFARNAFEFLSLLHRANFFSGFPARHLRHCSSHLTV